MAWSVERIEKELLLCEVDVVALPTDAVVRAVNRVEQTLGAGWIESEVASVKGIAPAMRIIGIGLCLPAIEGLAQADDLITHIRRREQNAEAELTAIYLFLSAVPSATVELYPAGGNRKADFRVKQSDDPTWTTVEVTQPESSQERQRIEAILRRILRACEKSEHVFSLDILFEREPTDSEIEFLCNWLPEFCKSEGQQRAQAEGLGFLFLNYAEIGKLMVCEIPELAATPMIGVTGFFCGLVGGGPHHQVSVRIPFKEGRVKKILTDEAGQLPKDESGLVMIHVPLTPREVPVWVKPIEQNLRPDVFTRVSAVCLFSGGQVPVENRYDWLVQTKLIINPNAKVQLPDWIRKVVNSAGEAFERAMQHA